MKKFILLVVAIFFANLNIMSQGVIFRSLTFQEALDAAKKENKLVFLDAYTVWCGPCKFMADSVFPQKISGDFFNQHFVNIKFDMEKGEGIELAKRFRVKAFPTFFIINSNGEEIYRVVGGGNVESFIARVKHGLNPKNRMSVLEKEYESGKMSNNRLMDYYITLNDAYEDEKSSQVAQELLAKLSNQEKLRKTYWPLLETTQPDSKDFIFILENMSSLRKTIGEDKVNSKITNTYSRQIQSLANGQGRENPETLQLILDLKSTISKYDIPNKEIFLSRLDLAEKINRNDIVGAIKLIEADTNYYTDKDIYSMMNSLNTLSLMADKINAKNIVEIAEKLASRVQDPGLRNYLAYPIDVIKFNAAEGVYWRNMNLQNALGIAKNSNQLIFIDCYTTWCGPCKYMTENIFPQPTVGEFFNKNFINIKLNMENTENKEIGVKYGVKAYPTFIVLNSDGELIHKFVGSTDAEGIIEKAQKALDTEKNLKSMIDKYEDGNRNKEFLVQYIKTLDSAYEPKKAGEITNCLFDLLDDNEKINNDYWFIFESFDMTPYASERFIYLLENKNAFLNSIETEKINKKINETLNGKVIEIVRKNSENRNLMDKQNDLQELADVQNIIRKYKIENKRLTAQLEVANVFVNGNAKRLINISKKNFKYFGENEVINIGFPVITYLNNLNEGKYKEQVAVLAKSLSDQVENERIKQIIPTLLEK